MRDAAQPAHNRVALLTMAAVSLAHSSINLERS